MSSITSYVESTTGSEALFTGLISIFVPYFSLLVHLYLGGLGGGGLDHQIVFKKTVEGIKMATLAKKDEVEAKH